MIRVEVEDYCSECMDFEPDVEKPQKMYAYMNEITISDTVIRCKNRKHCEHIRRYLERKVTDIGSEKTGGEMP